MLSPFVIHLLCGFIINNNPLAMKDCHKPHLCIGQSAAIRHTKPDTDFIIIMSNNTIHNR